MNDDRNIILTSPEWPYRRSSADPNLMTVTDVGLMLGVSRQRADQLTRQVGFPVPFAETSARRVWWDFDVVWWAEDHGRNFWTMKFKAGNRWLTLGEMLERGPRATTEPGGCRR